MMKRIVFTLLCLCPLFALSQNVLNVHTKSGSIITFTFTDEPVLSYNDDVAIITSNRTTIEYPISELEKLDFSNSESSVDKINISDSSSDAILIYDIKGRQIKKLDPSKGDLELSLEIFESGIYIINQSGLSYKIIIE